MGDHLCGVYEAVVVDSRDPQRLRRVSVKVPAVTGSNVTDWIPTATLALPRVGTKGWVSYADGDPRYPVWMGNSTDVERINTAGLPEVGERAVARYTTQSLTMGALEIGRILLGLSYKVMHVETSAECRIRLYSRGDLQIADMSRAFDSPPPGQGSGVVLDVLVASDLAFDVMPLREGSSMDDHPAPTIPITVTSTNGGPVALALTYMRTE